MSATYRLRVASPLAASPEAVWAHASTMAGVNEELAPLRMSAPPGARLDADVPLGTRLFRSTISVAGVLPFDVHDLTLVELTPGRGFHEASSSLTERRWIHRRTVAPAAGGCTVEDDLTFEPRLLGGLVRRIVGRVFARRHAALRRKFGALPGAPPIAVEWS